MYTDILGLYGENTHASFINWSIGRLFTSRQKVKRRPIDQLIKLACVFSPYKPNISVYMSNKHT